MLNYETLKYRHRSCREGYPENLNLRLHRALSWLKRSESCLDDDGQFIFLWIAFNAVYNNEHNERNRVQVSERGQHEKFVNKIISLDSDKKIYELIWRIFPSSIRLLLDNQYIFQGFWDFKNGHCSQDEWQEHFKRLKLKAHSALAASDTYVVLTILLKSLYTLRNQLMHGGATFDGKINRQQIYDATRLMEQLVPLLLEIMLNNPEESWSPASYLVVDD